MAFYPRHEVAGRRDRGWVAEAGWLARFSHVVYCFRPLVWSVPSVGTVGRDLAPAGWGVVVAVYADFGAETLRCLCQRGDGAEDAADLEWGRGQCVRGLWWCDLILRSDRWR